MCPPPVEPQKRVLKHFLAASVLLISLATAQAALAQRITVEFDKDVDFSKFKTFALRDGTLTNKKAELNGDDVKKRIEGDIKSDLTAQGLVEAAGRTDLNIRYAFGPARKMDLEDFPDGWITLAGLPDSGGRINSSDGRLVIELRDPETRALVWRATVTSEKGGSAKIAAMLDDVLKASLGKFPPPQK